MTPAKEFRVTEDRRVFIDGLEIPGVLGFEIRIRAARDPEVVIRAATTKIRIDGYTDLYSETPDERESF